MLGAHWQHVVLRHVVATFLNDCINFWSTRPLVDFGRTQKTDRHPIMAPTASLISDVRGTTAVLPDVAREVLPGMCSRLFCKRNNEEPAVGKLTRKDMLKTTAAGSLAAVSWFRPQTASAQSDSLLPPPVTPGAFAYLTAAEIAFLVSASSVATKDKPTALAMPAFGWKLSDQEIADLRPTSATAGATTPSVVDARTVADVRKQVRQAEGR
jgi:hypothetical protein